MILAICLLAFFTPSLAYALCTAARKIPRRPITIRVGPWRAWCFWTLDPSLRRWYVSRKVGEMTENLYHPPLGYKDSSTIASYVTGPEARAAARKANRNQPN
jgi:hypothetical protein